jgi:hypothetical protein
MYGIAASKCRGDSRIARDVGDVRHRRIEM